MANLKQDLLADRPRLIADCAALIDEEVARKGGLSGLAVKGAFKTVKAVKPGFIQAVIDGLLDEWVDKLEPHYQQWQEAGRPGTFGGYVAKDAPAVAERLLQVTDARAHKVDQRTVRTLYDKLRPNAKEHVVTAIPGLGRVVDRNLAG